MGKTSSTGTVTGVEIEEGDAGDYVYRSRNEKTNAQMDDDDDLDQFDWPRNAVRGTKADLQDMVRMGVRQKFSRSFSFLSIFSYSILAVSTWPGTLATNVGGITDSGLSNSLWAFMFVFVCWGFVVASMAEMASMAPATGGQYHWVSILAPRSIARPLSYVTGWCSTLAWQSTFFSKCTNFPQELQSLLDLTGSDYEVKNWLIGLLVMAIAIVSILANTNIRNSLSLIGGAFVLLWFVIYLAILIILWVLAPRTDPAKVFFSFSDKGDPRGIFWVLAFTTYHPVYSLLAPDAIIHMAEEIKNSSLVLPRALMASTVVNGLLGLLMLITFCFTIGNIPDVISSGITVHLEILYAATNSVSTTLLLTAFVDIVGMAGCICALTSASRQLFAFARDGGVPFSSFIATVGFIVSTYFDSSAYCLIWIRPGWTVPLNAMLVSFVYVVIVSVLWIVWDPWQEVIVSVSILANLFAYLVSIACVRLKRWRNEPLPSRRWSLGRWGGPINDVAMLFLGFALLITIIPYPQVVDATNMNYNVVVWGGIVILSLAFYYARGWKTYTPPTFKGTLEQSKTSNL